MAEREIEFHEAANVFPLLEGDGFRELQEDIAAHGVLESIKLHEGKILDGRNRYKACLAAGVEPWFEEWDGEGSPLAFVVSMNLRRRHLDQSQRSMAAAKLKPLFEAEARARRRATQNNDAARAEVANLPQQGGGKARDQAAAAMNVSPRSVEAGSVVLRDGVPELAQAVERGEVKVSAAAAVATLPKAEQATVVANGAAAVKEKAAEIRNGKAGAFAPLVGQTTFLNGDHKAQKTLEASPPDHDGEPEDDDPDPEAFDLESDAEGQALAKRHKEENRWLKFWEGLSLFLVSLPRRGGIVKLSRNWSDQQIAGAITRLEDLGRTSLQCAKDLKEARRGQAKSR